MEDIGPIVPVRGTTPSTMGTIFRFSSARTSVIGDSVDEAKIGGTGSGKPRYEAGTCMSRIDVDLLASEFKGLSTVVEGDDLHAKYIVVKATGCIDICYG